MKLAVYVAASSTAREIEKHLKYIPDTLLSFGDANVRALAKNIERNFWKCQSE